VVADLGARRIGSGWNRDGEFDSRAESSSPVNEGKRTSSKPGFAR
jgi:hypothetical protein